MTRFLKLTNIIINTNKIVGITILPTKYTITIASQNFYGWIIFGGGFVESNEIIVKLCEDKDPIDYQIVKEWINQMK